MVGMEWDRVLSRPAARKSSARPAGVSTTARARRHVFSRRGGMERSTRTARPSAPSQTRSSGKRIVNVWMLRQRGRCSATPSGIASRRARPLSRAARERASATRRPPLRSRAGSPLNLAGVPSMAAAKIALLDGSRACAPSCAAETARMPGALMSSRRIFAGLGVALVAALGGAARAQADPVVLPPPTADVGQTTVIRLEGFPAGSTVQVQVAPHDDVAAREITVSHVPVDGAGSGAIAFTWPSSYQHCEQDGLHVTCRRRAWKTPELADVSAGALSDPGEANIASLRLLAAGSPAPDLRLAQRFRPLLEFDSSERWRPLEIQRLFADSDPLVCLQRGRGCLTASSPTALDVPTAPPHAIPRQPEFLDWPGFQSVPSSYRSPHRQCVGPVVLDCNSGPRSVIYAHQVA